MTPEECAAKLDATAFGWDEGQYDYLRHAAAHLRHLERGNNELRARLEALAELTERWAKDAYKHRDHTYACWIAVHKLANGDHDVVG